MKFYFGKIISYYSQINDLNELELNNLYL
jgi:hypothetical protein